MTESELFWRIQFLNFFCTKIFLKDVCLLYVEIKLGWQRERKKNFFERKKKKVFCLLSDLEDLKTTIFPTIGVENFECEYFVVWKWVFWDGNFEINLENRILKNGKELVLSVLYEQCRYKTWYCPIFHTRRGILKLITSLPNLS